MKSSAKYFAGVLAVFGLAAALANCRTHIAESDAAIIVGPYPVKNDIENLKSNGISKIICLLDPNDPYENILLVREQDYAQQAGLTVQNFGLPRDSTAQGYSRIADQAATAIASQNGKVYLHSYLTSTRTLFVEQLLRQKGLRTTVYILPRKAGAELTYALDSAQAAYQASHFQDVLRLLAKRPDLDRRSQLLLAWATYHLNRTEEAKHEFDSVLHIDKDDDEAIIGLGYCNYREHNLPRADSLFSLEIAKHADDPSANAGLGLTRYEEGKLDDAHTYLTTSLRTDSINVEAGRLLLRIDSIQGKRSTVPSTR